MRERYCSSQGVGVSDPFSIIVVLSTSATITYNNLADVLKELPVAVFEVEHLFAN